LLVEERQKRENQPKQPKEQSDVTIPSDQGVIDTAGMWREDKLESVCIKIEENGEASTRQEIENDNDDIDYNDSNGNSMDVEDGRTEHYDDKPVYVACPINVESDDECIETFGVSTYEHKTREQQQQQFYQQQQQQHKTDETPLYILDEGDDPSLANHHPYVQTTHNQAHVYENGRTSRYACDFCDYSSNFLTNLKRHVRTHTGETPFVCSVCDYKCKQKHHLASHMEKKHPDLCSEIQTG